MVYYPHELMQHVAPRCSFQNNYNCKIYIQMAFLSNELLRHVDSSDFFLGLEYVVSHKLDTFEWLTWYFPHKLMQNVDSNCPFLNCRRKYHIWMASFPHVLLQYVDSSYSLENKHSHIYDFWMAQFLHEHFFMDLTDATSVVVTKITFELQELFEN